MNREKRVSVRFSAVGGESVKAEVRGIGDAGRESLDRVAASAAPAEAGLDHISSAAVRARQQLEQMAAKAAASAAQLRTTTAAATQLQAQINRATGVSSPTGMSAAEMLQQGQALDDLRAKFNPVYAAIRQHRQAVSELRAAHLNGAISADELAAATSRSRQASLASIAAYKGQSQAIEQVSRSSRGATLRMQNMFYQVNDIGVSLVGGMNPFVVMAQQGTQIAQIYGFGNGGVSAIFRDLGGMISKMPGWLKIVGVAAGAAALAFKGLQSEINKTSDVTVSLGDTAKAVFQVIGGGIWQWIKPAVDLIAPWFSAAWARVGAGAKLAGNTIINTVRLAVAGIGIAVDAIPAMFQKAFQSALAEVLWAVGSMSHGLYDFLDSAAKGLNSVFNTEFGAPVGLQTFGTSMLNRGSDASATARGLADRADFFGRFGPRALDIMRSDPLGDFYDAVSERAQQNARDRLAKEDDGKGGGGGAAKAEKDAVADLVKQLEQELLVLRETDPIKKKMLEYSEQLAGATDQERQAVLGLVTTLDKAQNGFEAVGRTLKEYAQDSKRLGGEMGDSLVSAFGRGADAVAEFTKTGKFSFSDMISSFASDLGRLAAQEHVFGPLSGWLGNMFAGMADPLSGALRGAGLDAIPSFDGGGHTGYGPRSGGLDGKGGFMAMVHPGERIVDETKGRGRGGMRIIATHDPGIVLRMVDERVGSAIDAAEQRQAQRFLGNVRSAGAEADERFSM